MHKWLRMAAMLLPCAIIFTVSAAAAERRSETLDCTAFRYSMTNEKQGWYWEHGSKTLTLIDADIQPEKRWSNETVNEEVEVKDEDGNVTTEESSILVSMKDDTINGIVLPEGSKVVLLGENKVSAPGYGIYSEGEITFEAVPVIAPQDIKRLEDSSDCIIQVWGEKRAFSVSGLTYSGKLEAGSDWPDAKEMSNPANNLYARVATKPRLIIDITTCAANLDKDGFSLVYRDGTMSQKYKTDGEYTFIGSSNVRSRFIKVLEGANVKLTFEDLNLNHSKNRWTCAMELEKRSITELTLKGSNALRSGTTRAGIDIAETAKLIINESTGSLLVEGGAAGAGIGGSADEPCGSVEIRGGTVDARGYHGAAGIGQGSRGQNGEFSVSGGMVRASGGYGAAGFGGGSGGSGGTAKVSGGTLIAKGGLKAPGIGSGAESLNFGSSITGGTVAATGGKGAAGIGSGVDASGCSATISGGIVQAAGGYGSPGLCGDAPQNYKPVTADPGVIVQQQDDELGSGGPFGSSSQNGASGNSSASGGGTAGSASGSGGTAGSASGSGGTAGSASGSGDGAGNASGGVGTAKERIPNTLTLSGGLVTTAAGGGIGVSSVGGDVRGGAFASVADKITEPEFNIPDDSASVQKYESYFDNLPTEDDVIKEAEIVANQAEEGSGQTGEGSGQTGEGSGQTGEGSGQTGEGSGQTGEGSGQTGEGSGQTGEGASQTGEGSSQTGEGSGQTGEGSGQTGEGSGQTGEGASQTGEGLGQTGEGSGQTGEGSGQTGEGSGQPGEGSGQTGEGSGQPGEGSGQTGEGSGQTGEGSGQTGEGSGQTGEGSGQTGEGSGQPGEGSGQTGEGSGQTGEGSGQPGEGSGQTGEGSGQTGEGSGQTGEGSGQTGEGSGQTGEGSGQTGEGSGQTGEGSGQTGEGSGQTGDSTGQTGDGSDLAEKYPLGAAGQALKEFDDLDRSAWYLPALDFAATRDLIDAVDGDRRFGPKGNVTRAVAVQAFMRLAGAKSNSSDSGYSDVPKDKPYASAVAWADKAGIVKGYEDGTFRPEAYVTREEMCVLIMRFSMMRGDQLGVALEETFIDNSDIRTWAFEAVYRCKGSGLVNGRGDGRFYPEEPVTRVEMSQMLYKLEALHLEGKDE